ncbi:MAG: hypothetical protein NPIRA02_03130 [Nitrospirales bacterium]|nr:MAG: hypothetical protein NPIRA02_03130 [Nitrospirales bacterium]
MPPITAMLEKHGVTGVSTIDELSGGRNNRVWRVQANDCTLVAKQYFNDPGDTRKRQRTEYDFSRFIWDAGIRDVPWPFIYEEEVGVTFFEDIPGRKILRDEVCLAYLKQVIKFVQMINRQKHRKRALSLPAASESCFSIAEHVYCIEKRVKRLESVQTSTPFERRVWEFIRSTLFPCWENEKQKVLSSITSAAYGKILSMSERCLSPSDLGFHNALLGVNATLRFIDFEYAGWDDPAKLVCDFFCQPEVPVSVKWFDVFVQHVTSELPESEQHQKRAKMLFPLYQIKWACILLNEFLPIGAKRRVFAGGMLKDEKVKRGQFQKAKQFIEPILKQNLIRGTVFDYCEPSGVCL